VVPSHGYVAGGSFCLQKKMEEEEEKELRYTDKCIYV
jgi:hypothetical protein